MILWSKIILHHSFTTDKKIIDWTAIKRYHTSWRYKNNIITEKVGKTLISQGKKGVIQPWSDIGYHFGYEKVNDTYTLQIGRGLDQPGAHCRGRNHDSIGIVAIGNFDKEEPSLKLFQSLSKLVRGLQIIFDIPTKNIFGHCNFSQKTCPGKLFSVEDFRKYVKWDWGKFAGNINDGNL